MSVRLVKGGPDIPADQDGCSDLARSRESRPVAGLAPSRAKRVAMAVSAHIAHSLSQECRPWFISQSNKALATVPFLNGMVGRIWSRKFVFQDEWAGLVTASDHVKRPLGLALVGEAMAQLHGCASQGWMV